MKHCRHHYHYYSPRRARASPQRNSTARDAAALAEATARRSRAPPRPPGRNAGRTRESSRSARRGRTGPRRLVAPSPLPMDTVTSGPKGEVGLGHVADAVAAALLLGLDSFLGLAAAAAAVV